MSLSSLFTGALLAARGRSRRTKAFISPCPTGSLPVGPAVAATYSAPRLTFVCTPTTPGKGGRSRPAFRPVTNCVPTPAVDWRTCRGSAAGGKPPTAEGPVQAGKAPSCGGLWPVSWKTPDPEPAFKRIRTSRRNAALVGSGTADALSRGHSSYGEGFPPPQRNR